jgi:hypothetical protein
MISGNMSPAMWPHFVNLLHQSRDIFLALLGTTGLGWWVQGIIWFIATELATYGAVWIIRGKDAMRARAAQNLRIGFYAWLCVMFCVYTPIFGYGVAKAVFEDHRSLVSSIHDLASTNRQLTETNSHLVDPKTRDDEIIRLKEQLRAKPQAGKSPPPAPTAPEKRQWHVIPGETESQPDSDGLVASTVLVYPSRSLPAPFTLRATFSGSMFKLPQVGMHVGGYFQRGPMEIRGNVLTFGFVSSPNVGPDTPIYLTVYGQTALQAISVECVNCND